MSPIQAPESEATRVSCTPRYVCAWAGWPARPWASRWRTSAEACMSLLAPCCDGKTERPALHRSCSTNS
jgi:hypothetical protein